MNIVEFALKFKDMASDRLRQFGTASQQTFRQAQQHAGQMIERNNVLGQSYGAIQQRIHKVEETIRNSTIKSEIREARKELEALQRQASKHPGNIGGGRGSGSGGFSVGNLVKGGVIAGTALKLGGAAISSARNFVGGSAKEYEARAVAETRLAAIMRNTMNAGAEQVKVIRELTEAQQRLGVVSSAVQMAGAQELSTYLSKTESLKQLIPVMNDMLAQQYGLNASQYQAQSVATMLGRVMDGQLGALSRYGYQFDEAQGQILRYGTEAQRVATLMEVVSASVGGVNEALAQTPEGILKQQQMAMEDLKARVGRTVIDMRVAFAPLGNMVMSFVDNLLPMIEGLVTPIANGVQRLVEWVKSLRSETGGFAEYWNVIKNLFTNAILPYAQMLWDYMENIVSQVVEFVRTSQLLKDIFRFIGWLISGIFKTVGVLMSWLKDFFDRVIMPILRGIERAYRFMRWWGGEKSVTIEPTTAEKKQAEENTDLMKSIAQSSLDTSRAVRSTEQATTSGGPRIININVQKFMDYLNITTNNLGESEREIEDIFSELFARVLLQGARV